MYQLVIAALTIMCSKAVSASLVLRLVHLAQQNRSVVILVLPITSSTVAVAPYVINPALYVLPLGLTIALPVKPVTI